MTTLSHTIETLADEIDLYYETEERTEELFDSVWALCSNGDTLDFNYFAYLSVRDLRDSDEDDLYDRYLLLDAPEAYALTVALATRFHTHLRGI